jgi:hypothetical protein
MGSTKLRGYRYGTAERTSCVLDALHGDRSDDDPRQISARGVGGCCQLEFLEFTHAVQGV